MGEARPLPCQVGGAAVQRGATAPNLLPPDSGEIQCGLAISLPIVRTVPRSPRASSYPPQEAARNSPLGEFHKCALRDLEHRRRPDRGSPFSPCRMAGPHGCQRQHTSAPKWIWYIAPVRIFALQCAALVKCALRDSCRSLPAHHPPKPACLCCRSLLDHGQRFDGWRCWCWGGCWRRHRDYIRRGFGSLIG